MLLLHDCAIQDEEDIYGEEAKGEEDPDDDDDEGEDAAIQATLQANVRVTVINILCPKIKFEIAFFFQRLYILYSANHRHFVSLSRFAY